MRIDHFRGVGSVLNMVSFLVALVLGLQSTAGVVASSSDAPGTTRESPSHEDQVLGVWRQPSPCRVLAAGKRTKIPDGALFPDAVSRLPKRFGVGRSSSSGGPVGMVSIPSGTFQMGSPAQEFGRSKDERQWMVTLRHPFFICDHEVTLGEYEKIMGTSPGESGDPGLPVVMVSWENACEYCRQLTILEQKAGRLVSGEVYRLPTEAEWEFAARCGSLGPRYGDLDGIAWWAGNAGAQVQFPKGKLPNRYHLFDMIGNVSEWCLDRYGPYPEGSGTDPVGATTGLSRVVRGGSWSDGDLSNRSASRGKEFPESQLPTVGFRIVRGQPVSP